ncbi:hypothetical protein SAMN04487941_0169 [Pontibacter akesuensis]|uniref:Uncharacterized protein n=2 Tax=Pontibacter akesuensis TaxID=388950 RepID=A0A1I7FFP8_9BACT|nr:hypothetical protein SAMN04487941_0169 [Pontibacter akesuensis]
MAIASCQVQKPYGEILAYDYDVYQHELQLKYHTKGRGNIHTYSLAKYEYDQFNWIYTNRLEGKIEADSLVFTYRHLNSKFPQKQSALKGYIEVFGDSTISINLEMPRYKESTISHWEPYEFNGTYKLVKKQGIRTLVEKN